MKLSTLSMIAMALAGSIAAAPVAAQERRVVVERTVVRTSHRNVHRPRRVCTTRWVNHHRVQRCRYR